MPHNELLDLLISQFSLAPYWSLKSLNEHVKQPQTYLKQTLAEIANLVRNGPYAGMWALKQEFKQGSNEDASNRSGTSGNGAGSVKKEEEGGVGGGQGESGGFRVKSEEGLDPSGVLNEDIDAEDDEDDEEEDGMEFVS